MSASVIVKPSIIPVPDDSEEELVTSEEEEEEYVEEEHDEDSTNTTNVALDTTISANSSINITSLFTTIKPCHHNDQRDIYCITGSQTADFVRSISINTFGNLLNSEHIDYLTREIQSTRQIIGNIVCAYYDNKYELIDGPHRIMALRKLNNDILATLTLDIIVYHTTYIDLKKLFIKLNTMKPFSIESGVDYDAWRIVNELKSFPGFKVGIKDTQQTGSNFPHIHAGDMRQRLSIVLATLGQYDINNIITKLTGFNLLCSGKPISTHFKVLQIDDKLRQKFKKMEEKSFYLASPYGMQWDRYLLGENIDIPSSMLQPAKALGFTLKIV